MKTVRIKKAELREIVAANRERHVATFEQAWVRYRELVLEELDAMRDEALAGKKIRRSISLVEPQNHADDYDQLLRMLDLEVSEEVELGYSEFTNYVMDDWGWKQQWNDSTAVYLAE